MRFPIPMFDYHQQLEAPQNQDCGATWRQFHAVSFRPQLCSLGFPWVEVVWDTILRRFGFHPTWIEGQKMRPEVWPCEVSFSLRCWISQYITTYCGWKNSCTTLDGWNPINTGIDHLPTGAGFLPSTVSQSSATCHFFNGPTFNIYHNSMHLALISCVYDATNAKALVGQSLRGFDRSSGGGCSGGSPTTDHFFYGWEFLSNLYGIM